MDFYRSQAAQNLNDAEEIAKENGTWDSICSEVEDIRSTMESMGGCEDDDFQNCYLESINLKARA